MPYVETSILVAYYCPERLTTRAQGILARQEDVTISPLVHLEVFSAVAKKVRGHELDVDGASAIMSTFQLHLQEGRYRWVPIEAREYGLARNWIGSLSTPLRTLDALHLAAAFANGLTLLTADKDLAGAAEHFGVLHELIQ